MDSIPVLSQFKSLVQVTFGDAEGAKETQDNFLKRCPVVSQLRSLVELAKGDKNAAVETQKEFAREVSRMANGVPGLGHVKGGIHYICGDKEGGVAAMKASSRTTGSIIGGVGGFTCGGPAGAVAGGMYGGIAVDGLIVGITAVVDDKPDLHGTIGIVNDIFQKENKAGSVVDLVGLTVFDGLCGLGAGEMYRRKNVAHKTQTNKTHNTRKNRTHNTQTNGTHITQKNITHITQKNITYNTQNTTYNTQINTGIVVAPAMAVAVGAGFGAGEMNSRRKNVTQKTPTQT